MRDATQRQMQFFEWIRKFKERNSYSPTIAEIAKGMGVYPTAAANNVEALTKKGLITTTPNIARSIVITKAH